MFMKYVKSLDRAAYKVHHLRVLRPEQCRAARSLLGWSQTRLAREAGLKVLALRRFENGHTDPRASTLAAIERALSLAGIELIEGNGIGVRLHRRP
jgi:transcriptional regulator with XRE-family HTH domain